MKDLKHIHYFESLLQEANNELVKEAVNKGGIPLGYTCYFVPEILLNVGKAFSVRLRAPNTGSLDLSTYYLTNFLCGYSKAILERGIEGGYNFLGALIGSETCAEMNRAIEHFELLNLIKNENFFVAILDAPIKISQHGIEYYSKQLRRKLLKPLNENYGIDTSDTAIRKAVEMHNEISLIMNHISEFRKEDNPKITGTEFHILCLIVSSCPKELIIDKLRETLEEIKVREKDEDYKYRARVAIVGSEIDDYKFTELVEVSGALVVVDRYCFGSFPGMELIELRDGEDIVETIVRHYFETSQCPRFMSKDKVEGRREYVQQLVKEFNADGVIYQALKFCEFWGYEKPLASHVLTNEYNIPTVTIDKNYTLDSAGQIRTRLQAFVESLEIKRINKS